LPAQPQKWISYQAVLTRNPHDIPDWKLFVEE
jgi:hypothetical protein